MNPDARLRRALQPVDPSPGFAQRVRAQVARERTAAIASTARRPWRWMAVAAGLLAVLGGPPLWREYEQRREALEARAQVLLALQIASRELNSAHRKVVRPVASAAAAADTDSGKEGRP